MTTMSIQQLMETAIARHRAGQLQQAEAGYRQVLSQQPDYPRALHLLGLVYYQAGQFDAALQCIGRAIALDNDVADYHLNHGVVFDRLDRLPQAIVSYRRALALNPQLPEAYANLGSVLRKTGNLPEAAVACRRALELRPDYVEAHLNLGNVLQDQGEVDSAIAEFERVIHLRPDSAEAYHNLGNAHALKRQFDQAVAAQQAALRIKPDFVQAANTLGVALRDRAEAQGSVAGFDEAIAAFDQALALKPDFVQALINKGYVLRQKSEILNKQAARRGQSSAQEAVRVLAKAVALAPRMPEAHLGLGLSLHSVMELDGAIQAFRQAVALRPDWDEVHCFLARALAGRGDMDAATAEFNEALRLNPDLPEAHHRLGLIQSTQGTFERSIHHLRRAATLTPNSADIATSLAIGLCNKGDIQEAAEVFKHVLELDPNCAMGHWNLGLMLLTNGDFERGWPEYEWRWRVRELDMEFNSTVPLWDGSDLAGRRILLVSEQGLGDAIQFVRYVKQVAERGGKIVLAAHAELHRLFQTTDPGGNDISKSIETWVGPGQDLPKHDVYCPLLSLPKAFGTTLNTIPATTPYLFADGAIAAQWKSRLPSDERLKVGLVWAGRPKHIHDRFRSIPMAKFAPVARDQNVWLCSLQKGPIARAAEVAPFEMADWTAELNDFADTAGLIANLDLVICADTAVAHLAGAMGKRVWVLIPYLPDWRWMLDRTDTPWYPTMRLFRQPRPGDWETVIEQIAAELKSLK
jgi:tetratricopeptide (TPR) repeat protein